MLIPSFVLKPSIFLSQIADNSDQRLFSLPTNLDSTPPEVLSLQLESAPGLATVSRGIGSGSSLRCILSFRS